MKTEIEKQLLKAIDDMEHNIENGAAVPFTERYRPYSNLYHYTMMIQSNKIQDEYNGAGDTGRIAS